MDKKDIVIVLTLSFIAFYIRKTGAPNISMYPDEWIYWTDMHRILANNFAPKSDYFNYTSPFFSYIGAATTSYFGNSLDIVRMISVIFASLTLPFMYFFGKEIYDRKTGTLAAVLFTFSSYHSLYSRIIMLEAFTLFFVTAFLYFFWKSQNDTKKILKYSILAGAMMGLAFDAKYITFFLIPSVIFYVLWTEKFNFKALFNRKLIVMFILAFLFFLPLIIGLFYTGVGFHGIYYYSVEKYSKKASQGRVTSLGITDLIQKGLDTITGIFAWGSDKLNPFLETIFNTTVILIFFMTLIYYLKGTIKREKQSSFLIISVLMLYGLMIMISPYKHYHIYTFPFYFVMFSHYILKSIENKNIVISIIAIIMLSLYIFTGATSQYWDKGEYSGVDIAIDYIKKDSYGINKHILIGTTFREVISDYSIYLKNFNASTIRIIRTTDKYEPNKYKIDIDKINEAKPDYLIFLELKGKRFYLRGNVEMSILKNYRIVKYYNTYFADYYILKRKNNIKSPILEFSDEKNGKISTDLFKKSIPNMMKVGKSYKAMVEIKNTGNSRTNYQISLKSNNFILYSDKAKEITLDKDSSGMVTFNIVPFSEYHEKLLITLNLYVSEGEDKFDRKKVDSVYDYVYIIEK